MKDNITKEEMENEINRRIDEANQIPVENMTTEDMLEELSKRFELMGKQIQKIKEMDTEDQGIDEIEAGNDNIAKGMEMLKEDIAVLRKAQATEASKLAEA